MAGRYPYRASKCRESPGSVLQVPRMSPASTLFQAGNCPASRISRMTPGVGVAPLVSGERPFCPVCEKYLALKEPRICRVRFSVGRRFRVRFWSFLAVFGWYSSTILRVYLTFQFLSAHPTVLLGADGPNIVQRFFIRYIHHPNWVTVPP
jgi:hypothetical protein